MREEKFQNIYEDMTVMRTNPMPNLSPTPNFSFGFLSGAADPAASSPDLLQSPPSSKSGDPSVSEERGESGTGDSSTMLQQGFPPPPVHSPLREKQRIENKKKQKNRLFAKEVEMEKLEAARRR